MRTPAHALIFAGGVGRRMHTNGVPKQFLKVYGKPVIIYTLEHFQKHPGIDDIVVVCVASHIDYLKEQLRIFEIRKVKEIISGGETGQDSIYLGLCALRGMSASDEDIVLVHDGVRPVITQELISENIRSVKRHGNAISASAATETITRKGEKAGFIADVLDRETCVIAKAPQTFRLGELFAAHEQSRVEGWHKAIDSATLMLHYGHQLHYVECSTANIKITTPYDYYVFKGILKAQESMQIIGV
ncbi:MAG: 2-C-methyl-D-erythritol 4-phosphate cytidylyltransferase [Desulfovibrio sp.]|nr:2-C-methyl-D-erythritol 4-phosphate cytidylyltransferase [Desulfovibrio sp.]